ncbi:hypothetical protein ACLOJK_033678 [Asimina triloba]
MPDRIAEVGLRSMDEELVSISALDASGPVLVRSPSPSPSPSPSSICVMGFRRRRMRDGSSTLKKMAAMAVSSRRMSWWIAGSGAGEPEVGFLLVSERIGGERRVWQHAACRFSARLVEGGISGTMAESMIDSPDGGATGGDGSDRRMNGRRRVAARWQRWLQKAKFSLGKKMHSVWCSGGPLQFVYMRPTVLAIQTVDSSD